MTISFKQFIQEETNNVIEPWEISDLPKGDSIVDYLLKNCSESLKALENDSVLWRGDKNRINGSIIDSTNAKRFSKDTNNLYQLMMEKSKLFSNYPKRTNSIICTSRYGTATAYGNPYAIFPTNGTKIVVSNCSDFIGMMPKSGFFSGISLNDISYAFENFFSFLGISHRIKVESLTDIDDKLSKYSPVEILALLSVLNSFRFSIPNFPNNLKALYQFNVFTNRDYIIDKLKTYVEWIKEHGVGEGSFEQVLKALEHKKSFSAFCDQLTPENLDLKLVNPGDKIKDDVECWFSGKAVIIPIKEFSQILHQLKQQNVGISQTYKHLM